MADLRVWVTGYRSYEMNVFGDSDPKLKVIKSSLKSALIEEIESGATWIISGGQLGVEQWGLEVAVDLKADFPELKTAMMLPFADFGQQWNETNQAQLASLRQKVDFSAAVSNQPYQNPSQLQNYTRFMTTHTDGALFVYDGEFPGKSQWDMKAAQQTSTHRPYFIHTIGMDDLEETARNLADAENDRFQF